MTTAAGCLLEKCDGVMDFFKRGNSIGVFFLIGCFRTFSGLVVFE